MSHAFRNTASEVRKEFAVFLQLSDNRPHPYEKLFFSSASCSQRWFSEPTWPQSMGCSSMPGAGMSSTFRAGLRATSTRGCARRRKRLRVVGVCRSFMVVVSDVLNGRWLVQAVSNRGRFPMPACCRSKSGRLRRCRRSRLRRRLGRRRIRWGRLRSASFISAPLVTPAMRFSNGQFCCVIKRTSASGPCSSRYSSSNSISCVEGHVCRLRLGE